MFMNLMEKLLETGIKIQRLLESNVFCITLEFDEWPASHPCEDEEIRPYNKTVF